MLNALSLNKVTEYAPRVLAALQTNRLTSIFLATVPVVSGALSYLKTPTIYVVAVAGALTVLALAVSYVANKYIAKSEEKAAAVAADAADAATVGAVEAPKASVNSAQVVARRTGWFPWSSAPAVVKAEEATA